MVYLLLVVVGLVGAIGDAALNQWARSHRIAWLLGSYAIWLVVCTTFGMVLKYERFTFAAAVILAMVVHSAVAVVLDRILFNGRFNAWELSGFVCAVLAVVLLEVGSASARGAPQTNSLISHVASPPPSESEPP